MKIPVKIVNRKNLGLLLFGVSLIGGMAVNSAAQQRDPFQKPVVRVIRQKVTVGPAQKPKPAGPTAIVAPPIQARIDGYRVVKQRCAELGVACPKPTSVLTLDEMQVNGIFRTPRGYAAMVEATPIKLSYTIYPGEKFYDGQLVAIEEARLVFRRITRMSDGKEIVMSSDKVLRQDTVNDLAATRSESQQPQTSPVTAATTGTPSATAPQISAEAVPLPAQEEVPAAEVPATVVVTKVNPNGLRQNKIESSDAPALKAADPVESVETKVDAVPAPTKTKAKAKSKNKN